MRILPGARNLTTIRVFAALVTVLATACVAVAIATHGVGRWQVLVVLAAVALLAEGRSMPLTPKLELSVVFIPIVLAAVLFGPASAALVGLAGMLGDRRGPLERFAIYSSTRVDRGRACGRGGDGGGDAIGRSSLLDVLAATLAAGIGFVAVDLISTMVVGHLRGAAYAARGMASAAGGRGADDGPLHAADGALRLRLHRQRRLWCWPSSRSRCWPRTSVTASTPARAS